MKKIIAVGAGAILSLALASSSSAGVFEEKMGVCLSKYANMRDSAAVVLECNAAGGKLSGCKVLSDTGSGKGFDKAALCVAEVLPVGSKTGVVKVPVRFPGS
ncbi:MAG TPA: hypothetical protein VIO94_09195 [Phenylobacterium sp.]